MLKKLFIAIVFLLLSISPALAQTEFSTDYNISYNINSSGSTHARFDITLTNNLSNIYASQFSLSIGSTKLSNINVHQGTGQLEPEINVGNKTTNINIPFKDKALGKDKTQEFTLEFDTSDFAHKLGSVWEISIPKLQKTDNLKSYNLTLSVPNIFGSPATLTPNPSSKVRSGTSTIYRFNPEDLFQKGISATFGTSQHFDFNLQYHLNNPNVYQVKTEIALPPDTAFQTVLYQTINPKPESIDLDQDGNWLATYLLSPKQNITVSATGSAQINLEPNLYFPGFVLENPDDYLEPQQYWEVDHPEIQKLANELENPQAIYQYVVDNLIYDYGRLSESTTRFGAANTLDNQDSAICMEFADLFVALTRAAGIPSRVVNGYAYTTNSSLRPLSLKKDILHAWPEYYDQEKLLWVPVDPTWGNTTGGVDFFNSTDLNHFSFTLLGLDSQYPVPAGAYKNAGQDTKDVHVDFGKPLTPKDSSKISFKLPDSSIAGVNLTGQILLENTGNTALYNQTVTLNSTHFKLDKSSWDVPVLPPFSTHSIDFELPAGNWHEHITDTLTAESNLSSTIHILELSPAYQYITNSKYFYYSLYGLVALITGLISYKLIKKR